jgi:hypothetical protein
MDEKLSKDIHKHTYPLGMKNNDSDIDIQHLFNKGFYFNSKSRTLEHIEARYNVEKGKRKSRMTKLCKTQFSRSLFWENATLEYGLSESVTPFSAIKDSKNTWGVD